MKVNVAFLHVRLEDKNSNFYITITSLDFVIEVSVRLSMNATGKAVSVLEVE